MNKLITFALTFVCLCCRQQMQAADWYVSSGGNGSGSLADPMSWNNSQTNGAIVSGDNIYYRGTGTFFGRWNMDRSFNGSPPVFQNHPGERPIFDCNITNALTYDIDSSTNGLVVTDTKYFRVSDAIQIGLEQLVVLSIPSSTNMTVSRANGNTTAASHSSGDAVKFGKAGFNFNGSNYWVRGFELRNSDPVRIRATDSIYNRPGQVLFAVNGGVFVNNFIHDVENGMMSFSSSSNETFYGNIVLNCGNFSVGAGADGTGYSVYTANANGEKYFIGNILQNGYSRNFQMYTSAGELNRIKVRHNVMIGAGAWADADLGLGSSHNNIILQGHAPLDIEISNNLMWSRPSGAAISAFHIQCGDIAFSGTTIIRSNVFLNCGTRIVSVKASDSFYFSNNVVAGIYEFINLIDSGISDFKMDGNAYYLGPAANGWRYSETNGYNNLAAWRGASVAGSSPDANGTFSSTRPANPSVYVYPLTLYGMTNTATVTVFNWNSNNTVSVSMDGIIPSGSTYSVIHSQSPFTTLQSGTYSGNMTLPMTNLPVLKALGATNDLAYYSFPEMASFRVTWNPPAGSYLASITVSNLIIGP